MTIPIEELGRRIVLRRGKMGVRAAAADVGVSPATLSRIENGQMPDLHTFAKICRWLELDPGDFLGMSAKRSDAPSASVHFRKKRTVSQDTASSLAEMILAAQRALRAREQLVRR